MTSCQRTWFLFSFSLILGFSGELFAQQSIMPICGNGICEERELDGCPSCSQTDPACLAYCDASLICAADCSFQSPTMEMTLNAETGVICHREPSGENACTQCAADGLCKGVFDGGTVGYFFVAGSFSSFEVTNTNGTMYYFDIVFESVANLYRFAINGFDFAYFLFNPNLGLYVIDPARICWECISGRTCGSGSTEAHFSLCAIEEFTSKINQLLPLSNCQEVNTRLMTYRSSLEMFQNEIAQIQNAKELEFKLSDFYVAFEGITKILEKYSFEGEWTVRLTHYSNLLSQIETGLNKISTDPFLKEKILSEVQQLRYRCQEEINYLATLGEEQNCSQLPERIHTFLQANAPHFGSMKTFSQMNFNVPNGDFQSLIADLSATSKKFLDNLSYFYPYFIPKPIGRIMNAIVLFVHWANDPYAPYQSSRAELNTALATVTSTWGEFSYGQLSVPFDVCEVTTEMERTSEGYDLMVDFINLCDPSVDFRDYDLVLLYPTNSGTATYQGRITFETADGLLGLEIITMANSVFHPNVLLHEGGHFLGLEHAHWSECGDNVFGPGCQTNGFRYDGIREISGDYGDRFDTMGGTGHYNCAYKEEIGWLTPTTPTCDQSSIILSALEAESEESHCIQIPINDTLTAGRFFDYRVTEPCDSLYIEYRKPFGYDESGLRALEELGYYDAIDHGGLALHCMSPEAGLHTWLLDCHPSGIGGTLYDVRDSLLEIDETCHTGLGYDISFVELPSNRAEVILEQSADYVPPDEECNEIDDNCNGTVDEGCDDDGDGYCDASMTITGSSASCPNGGNDCNDEDPSVYPATEICDDRDNSCDGLIDEGCDNDTDDYCDTSMEIVGTPATCPNGGGDCNDYNWTVNPGRVDYCVDAIDNNCNGEVDEGCPIACDDTVPWGVELTLSDGSTLRVYNRCDVNDLLEQSCRETPIAATGGPVGAFVEMTVVRCEELGLACITGVIEGATYGYCGSE